MKCEIDKRGLLGDKRGVAIVMVVGMLSMLTLLAVAFSISMRIERTSAGNFKHGVKGRHMIWASLASAIEDIDASIDQRSSGGELYISPSEAWGEEVLASPKDTNYQYSVKARVMSRDAEKYIPETLLSAAADAKPYLRSLTFKNDHVSPPETEIVGRYAYIAIDCSGLLDGNKAGPTDPDIALTNRMYGSDASEIFMPDTYLTLRNECGGSFDTLREMKAICSKGIDGVSSLDKSYGPYTLTILNDGVRSDGSPLNKVYIGGDDPSTWDAVAVKDALKKSGVPNAYVGTVYTNLVDYVDPDSIPQNLGVCCGEAVPMINKVIVTVNFMRDDTGYYEAVGAVSVECAYPFVTKSKENFALHYDVEFVDKGSFPTNLVPPNLTDVTFAINTPSAKSYPTRSIPMVPVSGTDTNTLRFHYDVKITAHIDCTGPLGGVVDSVPYPITSTPLTLKDVDSGALPAANGVNKTITKWSECVDPRYNWKTSLSLPVQWWSDYLLTQLTNAPGYKLYVPTSTGAENSLAKFLIANPAPFGSMYRANPDGDFDLYVANRALNTVGELGYLSVLPWSSISLYDHKYANYYDRDPYQGKDPYFNRVLDYFTIREKPEYVRGLVNIAVSNKYYQAVSHAFQKCLKNEYETDPARTNPVSQTTAEDIAYDLLNDEQANGIYTNLSDVGRINYGSYAPGDKEIEKEGIIRNTAGLLTTRHNLFTIILDAEAFSEGMNGVGGATLAKSRAVAVVWRDPYPDANGKHAFFLRYLKMLDD